MKSVYILRHAKSSWALPGLSDHERPLNERGKSQAALVSNWFESAEKKPDCVISSTSQRTTDTLDLIKPGLGALPTEFHRDLYLGTMDTYLGHLWSQTSNAVLLIGHNPTCDELTRYLTKPSSPAADKLMAHHFGTACLAVLEFDKDDWTKLGEASCDLVQFVRPKDLKNL